MSYPLGQIHFPVPVVIDVSAIPPFEQLRTGHPAPERLSGHVVHPDVISNPAKQVEHFVAGSYIPEHVQVPDSLVVSLTTAVPTLEHVLTRQPLPDLPAKQLSHLVPVYPKRHVHVPELLVTSVTSAVPVLQFTIWQSLPDLPVRQVLHPVATS